MVNNQIIIDLLKTKPGHILVAPDGTHLYALTQNAEGKDKVLVLVASDKNLNDMTPDEVNQFIIDMLKKV
ncbi:hypothetical protein SEA_MAKAI_39 [Arthrobacter phage Makai]|nr:hypothetical protein SEA_MAKAI_39 [Arthrobacter phage Makai]